MEDVMSLARLGVALLGLALAPTALAKPVVTVTVGVPQVVIAPPAPVVVVQQPRCPGPNNVWVDGSWRRDAYGRQIWVAGHCVHRPVVVHQHVVAPPPRTVIVYR
jgi:hypothetical protein